MIRITIRLGHDGQKKLFIYDAGAPLEELIQGIATKLGAPPNRKWQLFLKQDVLIESSEEIWPDDEVVLDCKGGENQQQESATMKRGANNKDAADIPEDNQASNPKRKCEDVLSSNFESKETEGAEMLPSGVDGAEAAKKPRVEPMPDEDERSDSEESLVQDVTAEKRREREAERRDRAENDHISINDDCSESEDDDILLESDEFMSDEFMSDEEESEPGEESDEDYEYDSSSTHESEQKKKETFQANPSIISC